MANARALIETLVGMPTVSADSNLALIDFARGYLEAAGAETRVTFDEEHRKANLFATLRGRDKATEGGIVLSGHTDVVPVASQAWTSDPFKVVERDGKLFGRGTSDMKSFIAIAMAHAEQFQNASLREPLHFAFSYDEEVGCFGVGHLIEDLAEAGIKPRLAIIGEPTSMQVINAHKGAFCYRTRLTGVPAHSSQPHRGVNANFFAARLIGCIEGLFAEARGRAKPESEFVPPYTTFNVGQMQGGTAHNIIPGEATVGWEFRLTPWDDANDIFLKFERFAADLRAEMKAQDPKADIVTEAICRIPPLRPEPDSPAEKLALQLTGHNRATVVSFGTEAGFFQVAGMPAVICGPGSIDQAHQPDEFISLEQVAAGEKFMGRLLEHLAV